MLDLRLSIVLQYIKLSNAASTSSIDENDYFTHLTKYVFWNEVESFITEHQKDWTWDVKNKTIDMITGSMGEIC